MIFNISMILRISLEDFLNKVFFHLEKFWVREF
jgi:hypothetical protein